MTSVLENSCQEHISYIISVTNSKFGLWIHLGDAECRIMFHGYCSPNLELKLKFRKIVSGTYLLYTDIGIPNCVYGYIHSGVQNATFCFQVTLTLTLGLNSGKKNHNNGLSSVVKYFSQMCPY